MENGAKLRHDYDTPWKKLIDDYFQDFMTFFFPEVAKEIDWTIDPIFLDKELEKIAYYAKIGNRYADKLARVWKKNGDEAWVLLHAEIQAQKIEVFPKNMFTYSFRIKDKYNHQVVSLGVLADNDPDWRPSQYHEELWGCSVYFNFPIVKIIDFNDKWEMLEKSDNPFAVAVMAHLKTMETKKNTKNRLNWKIELTKMLYKKGYSREKIFNLYRFIDWIMVLPEKNDETYHHEVSNFKEERKMQFVTTAERIGIKKGQEIAQEAARKALQKAQKAAQREAQVSEIKAKIDTLKEMKRLNYLPKEKFNEMVRPLSVQLNKIKSKK